MASARAVRVLLLLTGNPWNSEVATLVTPRATNSLLASIRSPWRWAKERAVNMLSE